jgi:hypothetical protein
VRLPDTRRCDRSPETLANVDTHPETRRDWDDEFRAHARQQRARNLAFECKPETPARQTPQSQEHERSEARMRAKALTETW